MKKFLTFGAIFIFLACVFVPGGFLHADACSDAKGAFVAAYSLYESTSSSDQTNLTKNFNAYQAASQAKATACAGQSDQIGQTTTLGTCSFGNGIPDSLNQTKDGCTANGGAWTANPEATQSSGGGSCIPIPGVFNLSNCFWGILIFITKWILQFMAWLLWLSGVLLNEILQYTIVKMSANISSMTGINIAWKVIRDVVNICFIFILVYEGIKLILSFSSTDNAKKLITGIIITALLINFSMFFTKIIIDASNIVTIGFYQNIEGAGQTGSSGLYAIPSGITGAFANSLHVSSLYSPEGIVDSNSKPVPDDQKVIVFLMGSILFLVMAFVFFAVSMMLIIRYITLIFLLMFSPLGFVGFGLPSFMSSQKDKWWDTLIGQCLFAPLWMFLTWVILTLITSPGFIPDNIKTQTLAGVVSTNSASQLGAIGLVLNFIVVIGLVVISLIVSKNQAGRGYAQVKEYTGKLTAFAGGAIMGAGAWAGRTSVGRIGKYAADSATLQSATASDNIVKRTGARLALYASKQARSATFDVRNATIPTSVIGDAISGTAGRTKYGKALGLNDVNIPSIEVGSKVSSMAGTGTGGTKGFKETREESQKRVRDKEAAVASEIVLANAKKAVADGSKTGANPAQIADMEKTLAKLSTKETETLVASNRELLNSLNFANKISVQQLEALNKSDQFSEDEKGRLKNARFSSINTAMTVGGAGAGAVSADIKALADTELEMIDPTYLTDSSFVSQLRSSQIEAINKSNKFTRTQKDELKTKRKEPLILAIGTGNAPLAQNELRKMSPKEITALGITTMRNPLLLRAYTPNMLKRMAQDMNTADIQALRTDLLVPRAAEPDTLTWLIDPNTGAIDFS